MYIVHCFTSFYLSLFCLFRRLIMYLAVCLYRSFLSKSIYLSFPNICKDFAVAGSSLCPGPGVDQADLPVDYSPSYPLWIARYVQYLHLGCTIVKVHCTLYIVQGSNFKLSPSLGHPGSECCHNSDFFKIPSQGYRQYTFILSNFGIIE